MDNKKHLSNKTFQPTMDNSISNDLKSPVKQCYYLEGKHFVIIDKSITQKLNFFEENTELFFQQEIAEDDSIILRRFDLKSGCSIVEQKI